MYIYKNGDRCPCCGSVIRDKSREWLLQFSAEAYALGFRGPMEAPRPGRYQAARLEPERTAEG